MCTINDNHVMHGSWDMGHNRHNFLSFWTIFCPFTLLTAWKMNISKKWKKCLEISSFDTNVPKIMIIYYTVPEIWCVMDAIVIFHFGLFFVLLPTLTIQKIKISKKWKKKQTKKQLEISSLYTCVPKIMITWCMVPEIRCATDGWIDRKSNIQRWVPHRKTVCV